MILVEDKSQIAEILNATASMAWPIIAAFLLWKLFPLLKSIVETRSFTIKIGGMELSAQDATDQIKAQIEDLQKQVVALRETAGSGASEVTRETSSPPPPPPPKKSGASVLWVDDIPSNNAFEVAQLQNMGLKVLHATSTNEAMVVLGNHADVDAIISDMGRTEDGQYNPQAGITLLEALRATGIETPFIVYTTAQYARQNATRVKVSKGDGATSSPVELLEWLRNKTGFSTN